MVRVELHGPAGRGLGGRALRRAAAGVDPAAEADRQGVRVGPARRRWSTWPGGRPGGGRAGVGAPAAGGLAAGPSPTSPARRHPLPEPRRSSARRCPVSTVAAAAAGGRPPPAGPGGGGGAGRRSSSSRRRRRRPLASPPAPGRGPGRPDAATVGPGRRPDPPWWGTRVAVWAPVPDLAAAVVVLDEHDEGHSRASRRPPGTPGTSPSSEPAGRRPLRAGLARADRSRRWRAGAWRRRPAVERAGWPIVEVVDRREGAARSGLFSRAPGRAAAAPGRVVCVLNRLGRSRLLACATCGEVADCERCGAAVAQPDEGGCVCSRCGTERPVVCAACGAGRFKNLRMGGDPRRRGPGGPGRRAGGRGTGAGTDGRRRGWSSAPRRCCTEVPGRGGRLPRPRPGAARPAIGRRRAGLGAAGPGASGGRRPAPAAGCCSRPAPRPRGRAGRSARRPGPAGRRRASPPGGAAVPPYGAMAAV